MTIGIYFAFIIFVMGTILAVDEDVSEEKRKKFVDNVLKAHNYYRKKHDAQQLKLDKEMCDLAEKYIKILKKNPAEELPAEYGFIYVRCKYDEPPQLNEIPKLNGKKIIKWMYGKGKKHNYNYKIEPPLPETTRNFTQILWKKTEKLGVAILLNNGEFDLLLTYSPAGNIPNEYVKNVSEPKKTDDPKKELPDDSSSDTKNK